jgi:hypothetical protein
MNEELVNNGYLLFRNVINKGDIEKAYSCFNDKKINYPCIKSYIENVMLKNIDNKLGWSSDYIKFRVSDNNNSSDASTFHRDIIAQENILLPSYTCLSYLDETVMEIIPNSHKNLFINLTDVLNVYSNRVKIKINPGDILLFSSTMLHRGIFTGDNKTRKLVQVFEVFPNKELLMKYKDNFIHVKGQETYSSYMQFISKFDLPISILNWIGYINASTGYGILPKHYLPKNTSIYYLSSEGLRGREEIDYNSSSQTNNRYVIKYNTIDLDDEHKVHFNHHCYNKKFTMCTVLIILFYLLFIYLLYKLITIFLKNNKK